MCDERGKRDNLAYVCRRENTNVRKREVTEQKITCMGKQLIVDSSKFSFARLLYQLRTHN